MLLSPYATRGKSRPLSREGAGRLIGLGGIVLPLAVLTPLLAYGLSVMPGQQAAGTGLWVRVTGEDSLAGGPADRDRTGRGRGDPCAVDIYRSIAQGLAFVGVVFGAITPSHDAVLWNVALLWHFVLVMVVLTVALLSGLPRLRQARYGPGQ